MRFQRINKHLIFFLLLLTGIQPTFGQSAKRVTFRKQMIATESAESVGVFDVNGDRHLDLVSGNYWYEGPAFLNRHLIGQSDRKGEYFDDFATIPLDINGDGKLDYITGGWFNKKMVWRENPGNNGEWKEHDLAQSGNVETIRAWDVDGDGRIDIVPNTPNLPLVYYSLTLDQAGKPTGQFSATKVAEKHGHGLGFGDINGDGRGDFIVADGWLEAPEKRSDKSLWKHHPSFNLDHASVPILVSDVNKDGLMDVIVGQGHNYGLDWYEQKRINQAITFIRHPIDPFQSQYHTMEWVDIDQDGENELITGKRYRAHNGNDPGANDPLGLYYFKWNGESFTKNFISYGPYGEGKGAGLYFSVADLLGTGRKDIIVAGKDGLVIFFNETR